MKNFTYKLFGSLFLLSTAFVGNSQIDVYYENFEGATSGFTLNTSDVNSLPTVENKWIINNNYVGGTFFNATCGALGTIINTPDQVPAITGAPQSKYMHIYSNSAAQPSIFGAAIFNCNFVVTDNPASTCVIHGNSFAKQTSPISTVGISNVTLSFYWICSAGNPVFGELYFSTNGGTVWTQLTAPISNYSGSSVWTQQIITNPQFDNQANLQFGFRFLASATTAALNDPAFGIDEFRIYRPGAVTNTISTSFSPAASYCPNGALSIPFTSTGTFTGGNIYTAQLSDASGSFNTPTAIGTLSSTSNSGAISATIPGGAGVGAGYKVRVISSTPSITGTPNSVAFAISVAPTAGGIQATTPINVCLNGNVSFELTGGSGTIEWELSTDGTIYNPISGSTGATTLTINSFSSTSNVRVKFSNTCGTVYSNNIVVIINNAPTAGTVAATTPTSVCTNGTASFNVTGGSGSVQWQSSTDGTNFTDVQGSTGNTFTSAALTQNTWFRAQFVNSCGGAANSSSVQITVGGITGITLSSNPPNITSLCAGPITLSVPSGLTSIVWSSGQTGVNSISVSTPGSYSATAVSAGGCQAQSDTITIVQSEDPLAGFTFDQPTPGVYLVNFTNTSTNSSSYFWDFGNGFTTTAANPSFTFNSDGSYPIRLIATNACGSDTIDITIVVVKVGINDFAWNIALAVFPNPFQNSVRIETELGKPEKLELTIYNMIGKLIHIETYTSNGKTSRIIDLTDVSKGVYMMNIKGETGSITQRIIKN